MAKSKTGGKTSQKTPRPGKRLGVKKFGGEKVKVGAIIVRQIGAGAHPGINVGQGRDYTLFALKEGIVKFGIKKGKKIVSVL